MKYCTIVADPPWEYPEGFAGRVSTGRDRRLGGAVVIRTELPYGSMSLADIAALPVADLAAPECRLFCWTTSRFLPDAFPIIQAWGFDYRQTLVWHKPDAFFGGSVAPNAEFLLVATLGKPKRTGRMPNAVIKYAQRQLAHSEKPECFLDYIEQVSPGPYLELFARRNRLGWDTWGNESLEHIELNA
jgi:N6-adenosine-specific RNA methylase IME4